jgi:hypothetical protein
MNASDIVKARQDNIMYRSYVNDTNTLPSYATDPSTILVSTVVSTIIPISSIAGGSTQYASTIQTNYSYLCQPSFITYESRYNIKAGSKLCGSCQPVSMEWINNTSTTIRAYSTVYNTLSTPSTIVVTSTTVLRGPEPLICPNPEYYQGTS